MIPTSFEIAHITITFTSPMIVASGASTDLTDAVCMRDPNGVPTIPGTSIAGALRHAFEATVGTDVTNTVFGSTEGDGGRSLLTVSWGHAHDSTDTPVSHAVGNAQTDSVVEALRRGMGDLPKFEVIWTKGWPVPVFFRAIEKHSGPHIALDSRKVVFLSDWRKCPEWFHPTWQTNT